MIKEECLVAKADENWSASIMEPHSCLLLFAHSVSRYSLGILALLLKHSRGTEERCGTDAPSVNLAAGGKRSPQVHSHGALRIKQSMRKRWHMASTQIKSEGILGNEAVAVTLRVSTISQVLQRKIPDCMLYLHSSWDAWLAPFTDDTSPPTIQQTFLTYTHCEVADCMFYMDVGVLVRR